MSRYLIQQTLLSIIKLFIFISFMFFFIQIMMPGDFLDQFALFCNAECRARMSVQLGLDLPIWERYFHWLKNIVTLDLGLSLSGDSIIETLKIVIPATLLVFVTGTIIAFLIGLWLGKITAWKRSGVLSRATTLGGLTLFTSFPPWLTFLFTYLFTKGAGFAVMGEIGSRAQPAFLGLDRLIWADIEVHPSVIAFRMIAVLIGCALFFYLVKNLIEEFTKRATPGIIYLILILASTIGILYLLGIEILAFDIMRIAWIPLVTYILLSFGETMMIMQASMEEVMNSEYVVTAKAKGLPDSTVLERHAARNALLPVISRLVISLPYLITGIVIIESSTDWPGMGTRMWNALYWQDMPLVMATLLIVGVLSLIARLLLDIITAYLDPRIRYGEKRLPSN